MNQRPLPPQLTWVCPLVRFACFHAVSAPRHLLLGHFSSTVSACPAFVCGKNCGQPAFCADSGRGFVGRKQNNLLNRISITRRWVTVYCPNTKFTKEPSARYLLIITKISIADYTKLLDIGLRLYCTKQRISVSDTFVLQDYSFTL